MIVRTICQSDPSHVLQFVPQQVHREEDGWQKLTICFGPCLMLCHTYFVAVGWCVFLTSLLFAGSKRTAPEDCDAGASEAQGPSKVSKRVKGGPCIWCDCTCKSKQKPRYVGICLICMRSLIRALVCSCNTVASLCTQEADRRKNR